MVPSSMMMVTWSMMCTRFGGFWNRVELCVRRECCTPTTTAIICHICPVNSIQMSLSVSEVQEVTVTEDDVFEAILLLKPRKCDSVTLYSEHLRHACPAISEHLACLFTSCLRHGYMPKCLRDSVIIPIQKNNKDSSHSDNYRPIALASSLSKVIEHIILTKYEKYLYTSPLQFGFKPGLSKSHCTALIKNVVAHYINNGSEVHGCFLDASKAFDRVDHGILFKKLEKRGLPAPILCFLMSWYRLQEMKIQWGSNCHSVPFNVSNGVRQGSVLSPMLFAVYLDGLLEELCVSGVGCHWRWMFAGVFCYADDLVLLAPCPSALRTMLSICLSYAQSHGLVFNAAKTQLENLHLFILKEVL